MNLSWTDANKLEHWIPIPQCKDGYLYRIAARNASIGIYREKQKWFEIRREKFGRIYKSMEYHWDADETGTAKPTTEIEQAPDLRNEKEFIAYMEERLNTLQKE